MTRTDTSEPFATAATTPGGAAADSELADVETPAGDAKTFDPATFAFHRYNWLRMAGLSGEKGKAWADVFLETPLPDLIARAERCLTLLRKNRRDAGVEILEQVKRELAELVASGEPLPHLVVHRWTYGIDAYVQYLDGDYAAALESLDRAEAVIREMLETHDFLTGLALAGKDFTVQRARVARNQRDWRALERRLLRARNMVRDLEPLIYLSDGSGVCLGDVLAYYHSCRLDEVEHQAVDYYYDPARHLYRFDTQTARIGLPAGFVVPYQ